MSGFNYFFTTELAALSVHCDLVHQDAGFSYFSLACQKYFSNLAALHHISFLMWALDGSVLPEVQVFGK